MVSDHENKSNAMLCCISFATPPPYYAIVYLCRKDLIKGEKEVPYLFHSTLIKVHAPVQYILYPLEDVLFWSNLNPYSHLIFQVFWSLPYRRKYYGSLDYYGTLEQIWIQRHFLAQKSHFWGFFTHFWVKFHQKFEYNDT